MLLKPLSEIRFSSGVVNITDEEGKSFGYIITILLAAFLRIILTFLAHFLIFLLLLLLLFVVLFIIFLMLFSLFAQEFFTSDPAVSIAVLFSRLFFLLSLLWLLRFERVFLCHFFNFLLVLSLRFGKIYCYDSSLIGLGIHSLNGLCSFLFGLEFDEAEASVHVIFVLQWDIYINDFTKFSKCLFEMLLLDVKLQVSDNEPSRLIIKGKSFWSSL
mmetsp:Transcript_25500/g.25290  ORF Transcript_25500/g.25290 Transcript_25500/m.25290 type:complete len:215 (+) Transcript_25500:526-1170(+)